MIALIFDTETTGLPLPRIADLNKQPKIIELAIAKFIDGKPAGKYSWLIDPQEPLEAVITKITGLTDEDLKGKPNFAEILSEVVEVFTGADEMIAHNLPFDQSLLEFELARLKCEDFPWPVIKICTVQEYRHRFGRYVKLTELYESILLKPLAQTHRAMDDVDALVELLVADGYL